MILSRRWVSFCLAFMVAGALAGDAPKPKDSDLMATVKVKGSAANQVKKDFQATIYASPPDVGYPVCVNAGPSGEVYIGIDENGSLGAKPNRGRVVRCKDTKGDGKADQFIVFAKMDSPRGIFFDNNVLYVQHPPFVTAYYDDKGEGVSNRSEDLVTGLGFDLKFRGADHTTNGMKMGMDGWLYIAMGDYGCIKAVGKDGHEMQRHGGGIVRVRPDGTELEMYAFGTRNVVDLCIDPLMNVYARDNTNDGDGWDSRLMYVLQSANYGYPILYRSFQDELIQPLADYGGGASTGAVYVDEPGLPEGFGRSLYTCDWGRNALYRNPLVPDGANYKAKQEPFVELTRPTGVDIDGQSCFYLASWRGATFDYAGPNAGFIVRIAPTTEAHQPVLDLKKATEAQLLQYLSGPSYFWRLRTSREIVRRGKKPELATGLEKLANSDSDIAVRAAAIFTLKQLFGVESHETLLRLCKSDALREYALRMLADRKSENKDVSSTIFLEALKDSNPRVRAQAIVGLGRLGRHEDADAIIPLLNDADPIVAHLAYKNEQNLHGVEACFKALESPSMAVSCTRVLREIHEPQVVDGLIERLGKAQDPLIKDAILKALCRLYNREADWDGKWWGTRPDPTGPYFKPVTWDSTPKIKEVLLDALNKSESAAQRVLLLDFRRNRIDLPETAQLFLKVAQEDPSFQATAIDMMVNGAAPSPAAIPLLENVSSSEKADLGVRVKALRAMQRIHNQEALEATVRSFVAIANQKQTNKDLAKIREEFTRDGGQGANMLYFSKLAITGDAPTSELACTVLLLIDGNKKNTPKAREAVKKAIDETWAKPGSSAAMLRAIASTKSDSYAAKVRENLADANSDVQQAAMLAAKALKIDTKNAAKAAAKVTVGTLPYEQSLAEAMKEKGDAQLGMELFTKLNCVNCHTVNKTDPAKGPFLGDIATRYKRDELIESILKPSAKIAQGFETHIFKLKSGVVNEGFIVREGGDEVVIRNATGELVLPIKDIVKRSKSEISVMPTGIADTLTTQELASVLAYLESLKNK